MIEVVSESLLSKEERKKTNPGIFDFSFFWHMIYFRYHYSIFHFHSNFKTITGYAKVYFFLYSYFCEICSLKRG